MNKEFLAGGKEKAKVMLNEEVQRLEQNVKLFLEVNMGATAIGTGINSHPDYSETVINHLDDVTGLSIMLADNLVEATQVILINALRS